MENKRFLNVPLKVLNISYENNNLQNKTLKAMEELGEFSRVLLKLSGSVNSTAGIDNTNPDELLEESIDVYLCVVDIINHIAEEYGYTNSQIQDIIDKKVAKWEKKFLTKNEK